MSIEKFMFRYLATMRVSTLSYFVNIGQKDVWVNGTDLETMGSLSYLGKAVEKRLFDHHNDDAHRIDLGGGTRCASLCTITTTSERGLLHSLV